MNHEWPGSVGLSVVILHYNRPWCLEIATSLLELQLEREGIPYQMILADDGSDRNLWPLFDSLPFSATVIQPHRLCDRERASVYDTLRRAYQEIRFSCVLFLQDDFWLVPQGFLDREKCHLAGLEIAPDFDTPAASLTAAVRLLEENPDARMVELARSFSNPRYRCLPESECVYEGIRFRAKEHARHPHFYSCDWPHVMRATDERAVPLPIGQAIWPGERLLVARRRDAFGEGNWVYDPEHCFFAHANVFTWRGVYKHGLADRALRWEGAADADDLPFGQENDVETNARLLRAYLREDLTGAVDLYRRLGPLGYLAHLCRRLES